MKINGPFLLLRSATNSAATATTFAAAGTRLWNSPGPAAQPRHHSWTVPTTTEETSFSGSMNFDM